jgi:hypothetical protein
MRRPCKVCGGFHDFFLCKGELVTDRRYEYTCPVTGQTGYLWDLTRVEAVQSPPAEGVEIRPAGVRSGRRGASV